MAEKPVEGPIRRGGKKDRSINYLHVAAKIEHHARENEKGY